MKKYETVYCRLKEMIQANPELGGTRLEREVELAVRLGVSRKTLRRAVYELNLDGLLRSVRGRGTFVVGGEEEKHFRIAVVLPQEHSNNYRILDGILMECNRCGAYADIFITEDGLATERDVLTEILNKRYDGVIGHFCLGWQNVDLVAALSLAGTPIVCVDEAYDFPGIGQVVSDSFGGMRDLVSALFDGGARSIGYVSFSELNSNVKQRFMGYCQAHLDRRLPIRRDYLYLNQIASERFYGLNREDRVRTIEREAQRCADFYAGQRERPEVYCAVNDALALILQRVFRASYPEHFNRAHFAGFDHLTEVDARNISSVAQDFFTLGKLAVRLLFDKLLRGKGSAKQIVKTKIRVKRKEREE